MRRVAPVAVVLAAAASAVLLNVLLLGSASSSNDPVGKLTPAATLPAASNAPPASPGAIRPRSGPVEGEGRDD